MNTYTIKICFFVFLLSCNSNTTSNKESIEINNILAESDKKPDSVFLSSKKEQLERQWEEDTTLSDEEPKITPLPFGPSIKNIDDLCLQNKLFYYKIIETAAYMNDCEPRYTKTYLFPPVDFLNITKINENEYYDECYYINRLLSPHDINKVSRLAKYKVRLPDFGKFQVFYMSNEHYLFQDFMEGCQKPKYGIIILYDKEERKANLLTIFNEESFGAEGTYQRFFYIDKDYTIHICNIKESYVVFDEEESLGIIENDMQETYKIVISSEGKFLINNIF
ncbi:MAG: hypothetical protein KF882_02905 [Bacteroidia bacterium]|nr:hypothetical protein [Bacteroidia bacterium]MCO5253752.1 hypothetical protein [Bacteroidota bacterium]